MPVLIYEDRHYFYKLVAMENNARKEILLNIKEGLAKVTSLPYPDIDETQSLFTVSKESPDIDFAEKLVANGGCFEYCEEVSQFHKRLKELVVANKWTNVHCWNPTLTKYLQNQDFRNCRIGHVLDRAHAGLTTCESFVSDSGSIVMSSALSAGRALAVFPKVWLVVATIDQVCKNKAEALERLSQKYEEYPSAITFVTGPVQNRAISLKNYRVGMSPSQIYFFLIDKIGFEATFEETFEKPFEKNWKQ